MKRDKELHALDMEDRLKTIIEGIILPHYPDILDYYVYSVVNQYGIAYTIGYLIDEKLSKSFKRYMGLKDETESLFQMLSPESIEQLIVVLISEDDIGKWNELSKVRR